MDTNHTTGHAVVTLHIDHSDLAARYAAGAISASGYAIILLARFRHNSAPELDQVSAATILRMVAGLPPAVVAFGYGFRLAEQVVVCLGLTQMDEDGRVIEQDFLVNSRVCFTSDMLDVVCDDEQIIIEPHDDPDHPGRRFISWVAGADDAEDRSAGPWYGYTPQAALVHAIDYLQAFAYDSQTRKDNS